jgi:hypothetical protein
MFLQEPVLYVASAALRCLVLFADLRKSDPNREASKKALEHKKEITKHLGRPFIQTNPYEVCVCVKVSIFVEKIGFFLHFFDLGFFLGFRGLCESWF